MPFRFSPGKSFAANVSRLANRQLGKALAKLAALSHVEPSSPGSVTFIVIDAIHEARKELKRARALLRLARHGISPPVFERENICLRDAGRALSATRDAQVLIEVFDQLAAAAHVDKQILPETLVRIRQRLADEAAAAGHAFKLLTAAKDAVSILEGVRARIPEWGLPEGGWRLLAGGIEDVYRTGRRQMAAIIHDSSDTGDGVGDAVVWHEWRKQVKHLGYQMRLLSPIWPAILKKTADELDKLAELLGDDHDLSVLRGKLNGNSAEMAEDGAGGTTDTKPWVEDPAELATFNGLIATQRATLQQRSFKIGRRIYQEKPTWFIHRFRGYWKAWREEHAAEVRKALVRKG